jgi:hypothetical protein
MTNPATVVSPDSANLTEFTTQFLDLVAKSGGVFEPKVGCSFLHLFFEGLHETSKLICRKLRQI